MAQFRIGIDLGGTKIEVAALAADGGFLLRRRVPTPSGDYAATVAVMADLVREAERELGGRATVGVAIPGAISPATGLVKNANSTALNGRPLDRDLAERLGRPVRAENDANCFALSEATDGAAAGRESVFGVILGTGCGGGIVVRGEVVGGRQRVAGEWGHNPLPWPGSDEMPGPPCWCGRHGCLETWIAGPALAAQAGTADVETVLARADAGDRQARAMLERHADRVARGLAHVINLLDPHCIVLGGGLSNMDHLYDAVPQRLPRYVFSDFCDTPVLRNRHGDSSGVRGAAWLWPAD